MNKLVGYQLCNFKAQDGTEISGYLLFFVRSIEEARGAGYAFDVAKGKSSSCFIKSEVFNSLALKVGANYNYSFTRSGQIDVQTIVAVK